MGHVMLFLTTYRAMKTHSLLNKAPRQEDIYGSGDTAPRILNLGTRWDWVVSFAPRPIYHRRNSIPRTYWI